MDSEYLAKANELNKRLIVARERLANAGRGIKVYYDTVNGGTYPLDGLSSNIKTVLSSIIIASLERDVKILEAQLAAL